MREEFVFLSPLLATEIPSRERDRGRSNEKRNGGRRGRREEKREEEKRKRGGDSPHDGNFHRERRILSHAKEREKERERERKLEIN